MAKETTIDTETARRLLLILSLEGNVEKEEIEWALGIIHQIPGYAGITMAKAVQDDFLKEVLAAIAAEQISPTTPENLDTLIKDARERKAALEAARETGEKRAEEFIQKAQEAAAKKVEIKPEVFPEVVPQEPEAIGIQIDYAPASPVAKIQSFRIRGAMMGAVSKIAKDAPKEALSLYLIANGVTSTGLGKSTETFVGREKDIASQIIQEMRGQETSLSSLVNLELLRRSMPSQDVRISIFTRADISQAERAQIMAFVAPGGGVSSFRPPHQSFLGRFVGDVGGQLFGRLRDKVVGKVIKKGAAAIGGKAAAAAVVGAAGGPPGWAVALASYLPDAASWLKRNGAKVAIAVGSALFGAGFLLQGTAFAAASSPLMLGGGALAGGGFVGSSGGFGNALSKSANFASNFLTGIGSLAVASIATPLIVALISIPVLVAIILFIINSGAYLVPPKAPVFTGILESPYIAVEKKASPDCLNRTDPAGKLCPPLPGEVTYEIEIKAKKGTLTNVRIENSYQIFGKGTGAITPPKIDAPKIISPTIPFSFSYKLKFEKNLDNSVIYDTLTVTADAPEQKDATASDVASVIIGNPPASSCPILGGAITTGSYNGTREVGHGSNSYWSGPAGEDCGYDIPAFSGCYSPTTATDPDGNNVCKGRARSCSYYGFATDVRRSGRGDIVQLPSIFGKSINWTFQRRVTIAKTAWGWGYSFTGSDGGNNYSLYLGHLNQTTPPPTAPSGTVVGTLYPGLTPPHVHIELQINGQWVRPDFLCGGVGP